MMKFIKATKENMNEILLIIQGAQAYLKSQGIDQWQNNYPNIEVIKKDIDNNHSYVLVKDNIILGTTAVMFENDKTYNSIYHGKWLTNGRYGVIHRLAVNPDYHGLGLSTEIIKQIELMCKDRGINSIKVDTHKENKVMQKVLVKNGFVYCGIIYLVDGNERMAFEKILLP